MICVDANVVLELVQRRHRAAACEQFLSGVQDAAISTLTLDVVMYFVERDKLDTERIRQFLDNFLWLPVTEADMHWAFEHYSTKDFEDAVQVACALRERCSKFVTLDQGLARTYADQISITLIR